MGNQYGAHLKARVQLQEVVLAGGSIEEVLHSTSTNVANRLRQTLRSQLHLIEDLNQQRRTR